MSDNKRNTGYGNTGEQNNGNCNTGRGNAGNWNAGNRNTGYLNTGNRNAGDQNTGNRNTGHANTGHANTGNQNTGSWNAGNHNAGFFCTETPKPLFFDKPCDLTWDEVKDIVPYVSLSVGCKWIPKSEMTDQEKAENPNYEALGGYLKTLDTSIQEAFPKAWAKMADATRQRFLNLPNFNAGKFLKCTGVDVRKPGRKVTLEDGTVITISEESYKALRDEINQ